MEGNTFYLPFEPVMIETIQRYMNSAAVLLMSILTWCGEEVFMVLILGFTYWCYDKELGKKIGMNILPGLVLNPMMKNIALRRRPYFDHPQIKCLKPVKKEADIYDIAAQGFSFPSGHAMNSAIIFGSLAKFTRNGILVAAAFIMPLLIGISRVALGVHYPTDVLVGWAVGAGIVFLFSFLQEKIKNKNMLRVIILVMSLPGIFYCRTNDYFTALGVMIGFFAAIPFEEKYVNFEATKKPLFIALRILGGGIGFFALNTVLKLPFPKELLESAGAVSFLIRTVRYALEIFLLIGVYPLAFRLEKKLKKEENK